MSVGQAWNNARRVLLVDVNNNALVTQPGNADDQPATDQGLVANARGYLWDGAAWDRAKAKANGWPGVALVRSSDGGELFASNAGDGLAPSSNILQVVKAENYLYNGANGDRQRGNVEGTLLASAARTTTTTSPTQTNHNARGAIFWLDVTANPGGAETLTLFPREINPVTGVPGSAFTSVAAVAATNGLYVLEMYPGVVNGGTNPKSSSYVLPRTWAVTVTHSGAGSWTYSVGYSLIV